MNLERDFTEIVGFCLRGGAVMACYYLAKRYYKSKPQTWWLIRAAQCLGAAAMLATFLSFNVGDGCDSDDGDCHRDAAEHDAQLTDRERAADERKQEHDFEVNLLLFLGAAGLGCVDGRTRTDRPPPRPEA